MDKIVADWKRNHTDIYTETSHRIRRQPSRSDAASYEDLGQSGFHASGSRKGNDTKRSTSGNKNRKQPLRKDDGSGDSDELNISETSGVDSGGESSRHGKANGEGGSEVLQAQDHVENARERGKVLKALKFKKKGRTEAGDETPVKANQGSDSSRTHTSRPSTSQSSETSQPHTGGSRSTVVAKKSRSGTTTVILSDEEEEAEPPNGYKEKEKRAKDRTNKRRARSRSGSKSPERAAHRKPRAFPMSPRQTTPVKQSSSQSRLSLASPQVSSRGEDADRTPAPARLPSRLPLLSPPSSYNSSGSKDAKGKGKTRTDNVEDGNKVRPFPMMVDDASENSSASESLKTRPAVKRLSDDVPGDSSSRKKFKTDDALPPPSGNPADSNFDYGDEFDSFFNTGVDHETLCPFCDSQLPKNPTPHLQKLIDDAVRKSKPQPRPTNRLGRKLAMGDYIHICQRHHFEAELLPQAEAKGWPKTIDFSKLEARVFKLKPRLKDILEDVEWKDQLGEDPDTWEMDAESPRALCVFWQETLKEVRSKGSKVAANVKSQFLTFHKTQPGYYGELGSVIIHHALYEMFPPSSVEPGLVAPLDPKEFIQRILVPEVAVRLIMEDRKTRGATGFNEAVQVLRDSAAYGVAMFPDDGSGGSNTGGEKSRKSRTQESDKSGSTALDEMLQEKARKRRKEIEEEEVEIVQREDRKKPARRKAAAPASEPQIPPTQPERARPRPKPKTRGKSPTRVDGASSGVSEAECDSVFGDTEDMCLDGLSDADRAAWDELNDLQAELSMDFNFDQNRPSREDNAPRIPLPPSPTGSLASNSSSKPKRRAAERANSKIISISSGTDSDEDDWSIAGNKTRSKGKRRGASRAPSVSLEQAVDGDETPKPSRPRPKPKPKGQECEPQTTTMAKARRHLAKGGSGRDEWSRTMRDGNPSPPTSPSRSKWLLSDDSQSQSSQSRL